MSDEKKLDEILMWLRFMNLPRAFKALISALDTEEKKIAYNMSNGENTSRDIAKVISLAYSTVTDWWQDWYRLGIAEAVSVQRGKRAKKLFELEDFGIKVSDIPIQPEPQEVTEEPEDDEAYEE